ncbi:MAG: dUTPase [Methanosarcinales archaeon]
MQSMDYLKKMIEKQTDLQNKMLAKYAYAFHSNEDYILQNARWTQDELSELIRALGPFNKPWKHGDIDIDKVKEEAIDVLHFLLNIFIALDMDAEDIYNTYIQKNEKNYKRFL